MSIKSYQDLVVWQKSYQLALQIYKITKKFPKEELYGLTSQMRRAEISIPSNIAEGYYRQRKLEYVQFLQFSFASGAELETQLLIAHDLKYISEDEYNEINKFLTEVMKMLNSLIRKLKTSA
jgi:four helix bundle protein